MYFHARGKHFAVPASPLTNRKALPRLFFLCVCCFVFLPCGHVGSRQPGKCWARTQSRETRVRRANMHSTASLTGLDVSDWIDGWLMATVRSPTLLQVVTYHGVIGVQCDISVGMSATPVVLRLLLPLAQVLSFYQAHILWMQMRRYADRWKFKRVDLVHVTPECTSWSATSDMNNLSFETTRAHLCCCHILQQKLAQTYKTFKSSFDPMVHSVLVRQLTFRHNTSEIKQ